MRLADRGAHQGLGGTAGRSRPCAAQAAAALSAVQFPSIFSAGVSEAFQTLPTACNASFLQVRARADPAAICPEHCLRCDASGSCLSCAARYGLTRGSPRRCRAASRAAGQACMEGTAQALGGHHSAQPAAHSCGPLSIRHSLPAAYCSAQARSASTAMPITKGAHAAALAHGFIWIELAAASRQAPSSCVHIPVRASAILKCQCICIPHLLQLRLTVCKSGAFTSKQQMCVQLPWSSRMPTGGCPSPAVHLPAVCFNIRALRPVSRLPP